MKKERIVLCSIFLIVACAFIFLNGMNPKVGRENRLEIEEEVGLKKEQASNSEIEQGDRLKEEQDNPTAEDIMEAPENNVIIDNPFFYTQELTRLTADIRYLDIELSVVRSGELKIQWLKNYENGDLFKLSVTPMENMEFTLDEERLNIYIYVTSDEIYRLWSYVYQDGETIEFYNDDALLMEILDTDEKLIENGELVCCKENIEDETDSSEPGKHVTIYQNENRITYNRVDIMPNGNRYFYERFVWEEGKGLVEYKSGYKQEADILYIENIEMQDE